MTTAILTGRESCEGTQTSSDYPSYFLISNLQPAKLNFKLLHSKALFHLVFFPTVNNCTIGHSIYSLRTTGFYTILEIVLLISRRNING